MCNINIIKRDGSTSKLDLDKINKVVMDSCRGVDNVSPSEIIVHAKLQFVDGMSTKRIQEILIKSAKDLVTKDRHEYQVPASRLQMYDLRKRVYGQYEPCSYYELYNRNVSLGKYDSELLDLYTEEEWKYFDSVIDHTRDEDFKLAAVGQLLDKYLVQDRVSGTTEVYYETPQMMYMAIAMTLLSYIKDKDVRKQQVKRFYDAASTGSYSLPTPIMAGVRTPTRQFSSCVLIKCGDSLNSINATASAVVNYVSKRAGIGLDHSALRGEGSSIRNGEMVHTGLIPFMKYHTAGLKSCSQGGIRGGAATTYYPFWHIEFENLIVLKNNKGIEENRERRLDYGIQLNGLMFELYMNQEDVYLFSPKEVPELYNKFFSADLEGFKVEYYRCVGLAKEGKLTHKIVRSSVMMDSIVNERTETGRIYLKFVDNVNKQSPFDSTVYPIYQSNLCLEIALPTKEFESLTDEDGRVALCTLASMNMGKWVGIIDNLSSREEFFKDCEVLVQALDGLLSYQDYPMVQAELSTKEFRTLGVGIVNLADFHAQHGLKYGSKKGLQLVNDWMELFSYGLIKASADLAKTEGKCEKSDFTCYGIGKFPWEFRHKNIDKIVSKDLLLQDEWETLRSQIKVYGIRNATTSAVAPTESSAQILNATNGMEMPKGKMSIKASKSGMFKQIVPNPDLAYDYLWEQKSPRGYLMTAGVMQKWVDQSLSTNTWYNPKNYVDNKIPKQDIIADIYAFYSVGGKTLYYSNIEDGSSEEEEDVVNTEDICDTCVV